MKLLWALALLIVFTGIAGATLSAGPGVKIVKDFTFYDQASARYLDATTPPGTMQTQLASTTDFQVYDRISKKWFDVTDDDLQDANAWADETGEAPLISSPYSGKAYEIQIVASLLGDEDYLECIPLTGMVAIEPSGYVEMPSGTGNVFWSTAYGPSRGSDGLDEHAYMYVYGWNPAILWQHMGGN